MNQHAPILAAHASVRELIDANPVVGEKRSGPHRFWTGRELKVLDANYPMLGAAGCLPLLAGRTAYAIYQRATMRGLARPGQGGTIRKRVRWTWTAQMDAAITRVYAGRPSRGAVKVLARAIGRPVHAISARALRLGHVLPRFKELPWSEAELAIVRLHGPTKGAPALQRILKKAGYARTATAVKVKITRLRIHRDADDGHYTAAGLAEALGADRKRVLTFIERGWLKARRQRVSSGSAENANWQISRRDARNFIIDNVAAVDFARADKFWLVDLLAEGGR